jgi:hypothetical protein
VRRGFGMINVKYVVIGSIFAMPKEPKIKTMEERCADNPDFLLCST